MDHNLRDRIKLRLASLRARFGADDPDVQALTTLVDEAPSSPPPPPSEPQAP
jgi:hypothetical protein